MSITQEAMAWGMQSVEIDFDIPTVTMKLTKTISSRLLRITALSIACLSASVANAIPIPASSLVGSWAPASAYNNETDATFAVNALITWYNGGTNANTAAPAATFVLSLNSFGALTGGFLAANTVKDDNAPFASANNATYSFVLGKYGNSAYLYYIGNLTPGSYDLVTSPGPNGNGLSHVLYFPGSNNSNIPGAPDGGTTAVLLGLALAGLALVRRKLAST